MGIAVLLGAAVLGSALVGTAVGADGDAPLAEAGLDQEVRLGETVRLDATGSYDPDGRVVDYEWQVETPDGSPVRPSEPHDARTSFPATAVGRYEVSLTSVREAHRRLARPKADGAQGFQAYALPIRRRCDPFRKAYGSQVEAARAAAGGETDRAETLASRAMERIVTAELEHPLPTPEGGPPEGGSGTG